jgi:hypothetical protein
VASSVLWLRELSKLIWRGIRKPPSTATS